jgi:hypothetical protein
MEAELDLEGTEHTGLWPSMDVLPEAERELWGQPILMEDLMF